MEFVDQKAFTETFHLKVWYHSNIESFYKHQLNTYNQGSPDPFAPGGCKSEKFWNSRRGVKHIRFVRQFFLKSIFLNRKNLGGGEVSSFQTFQGGVHPQHPLWRTLLITDKSLYLIASETNPFVIINFFKFDFKISTNLRDIQKIYVIL